MGESTYTDELAATICERLANGESLNAICKDDGMPAESTVRLWALDDREGFAAKYARARELQAECFAEGIVDISDEEPDPQRARVRIDARKWFAAKTAPKKFGDAVNLKHSDPDGGPVRTHGTVDLSGLTEEQLRVLASVPVHRS